MKLVRAGRTVTVRLRKDLTRSIKRGHAWLFSDAIELPPAESGTVARLCERGSDKPLAAGIYDPQHPIPLRVCRTQPPWELDDDWIVQRLHSAWQLRRRAFDSRTNGWRLVAGEGDGLPGLIIDIYGQTAVLKLDGGAPEVFYQPAGIAAWLVDSLGLERVVLRPRGRGRVGELLRGTRPEEAVPFLENGLRFASARRAS